jgi:hypothetical protein
MAQAGCHELSECSFAEVARRRIEPWDPSYSLGFHTLAGAAGVTLVDGLRPSRFAPTARRLLAAIVSSV